MRRLLVAFLAALLFVPSVLAHPVPKTNRDRTIVVHVTVRALIVDYRLELDEGSIPNELTNQERAHIMTRADLLETFTRLLCGHDVPDTRCFIRRAGVAPSSASSTNTSPPITSAAIIASSHRGN